MFRAIWSIFIFPLRLLMIPLRLVRNTLDLSFGLLGLLLITVGSLLGLPFLLLGVIVFSFGGLFKFLVIIFLITTIIKLIRRIA